jgi:hypothetical protein
MLFYCSRLTRKKAFYAEGADTINSQVSYGTFISNVLTKRAGVEALIWDSKRSRV